MMWLRLLFFLYHNFICYDIEAQHVTLEIFCPKLESDSRLDTYIIDMEKLGRSYMLNFKKTRLIFIFDFLKKIFFYPKQYHFKQ